MRKVIIYGASGHGKVILDILGRNPEVEVAGFFDTDAAKDGEEFCGYQIKWASDEALEQISRIPWGLAQFSSFRRCSSSR